MNDFVIDFFITLLGIMMIGGLNLAFGLNEDYKGRIKNPKLRKFFITSV